MSTSGPSPIKKNTHEITLLKKQMAKMMRMMQQLVVGWNQESFGPTLKGFAPHSENESQPLPEPNQDQTTPPFTPQGNNQEMDPPKDKTSESGYSQVQSQVETLIEKICITEGSDARGSVDLNSLTNFSQVIMPSKFKALELSSMMALEIFAPICICYIGRWHPMETITRCSTKFSLIA